MLLSTGSVEQRKLAIVAQQKELERQLALHQEQLHALEAERVKLAEAEVAESLKNSSSALMAHVSDSPVDFSQQRSLIDTLKKQQMQIAALSDLAASAEQRAILLDDLVRSLQTKLQESESRAASTVQALVNVVGKKELLSRLYDFKAKMNVSHEAGQSLSHLAALLSSPDMSSYGSRSSYKPTTAAAAPHQSRERAHSKGRRSTVSGGVRAPFQYLPAPAPAQSNPRRQGASQYGLVASPSSSRNDLELDGDPTTLSSSQQVQGRLINAPMAAISAGGLRKENPYDWAAYTARAQVMHNLPKRLNSPPSTASSNRTIAPAGGSSGSSILSEALSASGVPLQLKSPRVSSGSGMSSSFLSTPTHQSRTSLGGGGVAGSAPSRLSPAAIAAAQPLARLQRMAGENPDAFANALKRIAGKAEELTLPDSSLQQPASRPQVVPTALPVALKEKVKGDLASLDSQLAREEGFLI